MSSNTCYSHKSSPQIKIMTFSHHPVSPHPFPLPLISPHPLPGKSWSVMFQKIILSCTVFHMNVLCKTLFTFKFLFICCYFISSWFTHLIFFSGYPLCSKFKIPIHILIDKNLYILFYDYYKYNCYVQVFKSFCVQICFIATMWMPKTR